MSEYRPESLDLLVIVMICWSEFPSLSHSQAVWNVSQFPNSADAEETPCFEFLICFSQEVLAIWLTDVKTLLVFSLCWETMVDFCRQPRGWHHIIYVLKGLVPKDRTEDSLLFNQWKGNTKSHAGHCWNQQKPLMEVKTAQRQSHICGSQKVGIWSSSIIVTLYCIQM